MKTELPRTEIPPAYRVPRAPLPRWQGVALSIATVACVSATGFVANYQPLVRGHYGQISPCFEDVGDFTSARGDRIDAWNFICSQADEEVVWAISVINDGWLPITVEDVDGAGESFGVIGDIEVSFGEFDDHIPRGNELTPLRPFTIGPGEQYVISFRGVTAYACTARDTISGHQAGVGITFKIGPFTRHDRVDAGPAMNVACSEQPRG